MLITAIATLSTVVTGLASVVAYLFKLVHFDLKQAVAECEKERAAEKLECKENLAKHETMIQVLQGKLDKLLQDYLLIKKTT